MTRVRYKGRRLVTSRDDAPLVEALNDVAATLADAYAVVGPQCSLVERGGVDDEADLGLVVEEVVGTCRSIASLGDRLENVWAER